MKNIKLFIAIVIPMVIFSSCEDEDTIRIPQNLEKGANVRFSLTSGKTFLNFLDLANSTVEWKVFTENTNLTKVDLFLTYSPSGGTMDSAEFILETYTPASFTNGELLRSYTSDELAVIVGHPDASALAGGDLFNFRIEATLDDGRVYPSATVGGNTNTTPNIQNAAATTSFTETFFTFVGCPTELVGGTYLGSPTTPATPCSNDPFGQAGAVVSDKEVTLSQIGVVFWNITDVSGQYYTGFNFNPEQQVQLLDVCNNLSTSGTTGAQFNLSVTGTHDPATNQIDLQWIDLGNALITCENTYLPK